MIIEALAGGLFRLAPEVIKAVDRRNERSHELAMLDKTTELEKAKAASTERLAAIDADKSLSANELQAMIEAIKAQAQQTGIKWVDALNSLVRPLLAFQWLLILWPAVVVAGIVLAVQAGTDPMTAITHAWGQDEKALSTSIASFWLVDRAIRKMR